MRWRGETDVLFATTRLADGAVRSSLLRACKAVSEVWFDGKAGRTDGWFTAESSGGAHVEMTVVRSGRVVLSLEGIRVSDETLTGAP
jgi:hypothetical protein